VLLAFGTDYPVEPSARFAACTRASRANAPMAARKTGGSRKKKSRSKIASAPTPQDSAYAQFEEGKKGELKPGQYADFIILSNDLTKVPPAQFTKTRVLRTVVAGRTVYESRLTALVSLPPGIRFQNHSLRPSRMPCKWLVLMVLKPVVDKPLFSALFEATELSLSYTSVLTDISFTSRIHQIGIDNVG